MPPGGGSTANRVHRRQADRADFTGAGLGDVTFRDAKLVGVHFSVTDLRNAEFGADLTNADFTCATVTCATFESATLNGVTELIYPRIK